MATALAVRRRMTNERGAILVLTALGLVMFMTFAAVAVDLSALFTVRRHAQTVVDLGVLAGSQFAGVDSDPDVAKLAIITEVKRITATNLGLTPTESEAAWSTCVDPDMPPEFSPRAGQTACISFTAGITKIRVRLPDQTFDTFFAGVIGIDTLTTSAHGVAGAPDTGDDIVPLGIPTAQADATIGCPMDSPDGLAPCDGPDAGNFNKLGITQWGLFPPPEQTCVPSDSVFKINLAVGIDHPLGIWPDDPGIDDKSTCENPNVAGPPGTVHTSGGLKSSDITQGLITGITTGGITYDGRLTDVTTSLSTKFLISETVDDTPLWAFIVSNTGDIPANCYASSFTEPPAFSDWDEDIWVEAGLDPVTDDPDFDGTADSHLEAAASFEHMARCLREYVKGTWDPVTGYSGTASSGVLFDKAVSAAPAQQKDGIFDLQLSPRWGWSPVGDFGPGGSVPFQITRYIPIYINTLVNKSWVWHAGESVSGSPTGNEIRSLLSFQLPLSTLPTAVTDTGPNSDTDIEYTLIE